MHGLRVLGYMKLNQTQAPKFNLDIDRQCNSPLKSVIVDNKHQKKIDVLEKLLENEKARNLDHQQINKRQLSQFQDLKEEFILQAQKFNRIITNQQKKLDIQLEEISDLHDHNCILTDKITNVTLLMDEQKNQIQSLEFKLETLNLSSQSQQVDKKTIEEKYEQIIFSLNQKIRDLQSEGRVLKKQVKQQAIIYTSSKQQLQEFKASLSKLKASLTLIKKYIPNNQQVFKNLVESCQLELANWYQNVVNGQLQSTQFCLPIITNMVAIPASEDPITKEVQCVAKMLTAQENCLAQLSSSVIPLFVENMEVNTQTDFVNQEIEHFYTTQGIQCNLYDEEKLNFTGQLALQNEMANQYKQTIDDIVFNVHRKRHLKYEQKSQLLLAASKSYEVEHIQLDMINPIKREFEFQRKQTKDLQGLGAQIIVNDSDEDKELAEDFGKHVTMLCEHNQTHVTIHESNETRTSPIIDHLQQMNQYYHHGLLEICKVIYYGNSLVTQYLQDFRSVSAQVEHLKSQLSKIHDILRTK